MNSLLGFGAPFSPFRITDAARRVRDNLVAQTRALVALRTMSSVGRRARCFGSVFVENRGVIRIGDDATLGGRLAAIRIIAEGDGLIGLGDDVTVESGTTIASRSLLSIGNRVRIGPHCMISDSVLPLRLLSVESSEPRAIMIGDDVWLGAGVTIMPGVRLGARAVVAAGSVVRSDIPDGALTAGSPATILRVASERLPPVSMTEARGRGRAARSTRSGIRSLSPRSSA